MASEKKEKRRIVPRKPRRARWTVSVETPESAKITNPHVAGTVISIQGPKASDLAFTVVVALNKRLGA